MPLYDTASGNHDPDGAIRSESFAAVERLVLTYGGRIPWAAINRGFHFRGEQVHLAGRASGIFRPRQMSAALSLKTTKPRAGRRTWYRDQNAGIEVDAGSRLVLKNTEAESTVVGHCP